jgi:predicted acylesterase/phospholipase RssA
MRKLEWLMRELLPPTFKQLDTPLTLGVYHTCRGERSPLLLMEGDLPSAVAASCTVPSRLFAPMRRGSDPRGPYRYADGGAIDRTGVAVWRKWRPGKRAAVNLVSDLPAPQLSERERDGFGTDKAAAAGLRVVRTARARATFRATFLSLGNFEGERDAVIRPR